MCQMTWEEAVRWYRARPGNEENVRACYFDLPVREAACRFAESEEFREMRRLLGVARGRRVLDIGAGNGIASYALAKDGWNVTALDPDSSEEVGAGAIRTMAIELGVEIAVVETTGENLPFPDGVFDAVFARQTLHHAADLHAMLRECARVLKAHGTMLSTRDHVAETPEDLQAFLQVHPLHSLYGGENAFSMAEYRDAFTSADFRIRHSRAQLESILNFAPGTERSRRAEIRRLCRSHYNGVLPGGAFTPWHRRNVLAAYRASDKTPGRLVSILAVKSGVAG